MSEGPLAGICILDLGRMFAAPWAAQLLADMGADVIKIERPSSGDPIRAAGPPFLQGVDGQNTRDSTFYLAANRNKRSVTVDFTQPEGQEIVRALALRADILIENYKVGDLARYGLDYTALRADNPRLVYCSITGFGLDGPYRERPGVDSLIQALSGMMSITGEPDGEPQKMGLTIADLVTGFYAAVAILGALHHARTTGEGQQLDIALLDCAMGLMSHRALEFFMTGAEPPRVGSGAIAAVPAGNFACKSETLLNVQAGSDTNFRRLTEAIGHSDLANNPSFARRRDRIANRDQLGAELSAIFAEKTAAEWFEQLVPHDVWCAPVNSVAEAFTDPQVRHRAMQQRLPHPVAGMIDLVASPMRFLGTPMSHWSAPPSLGADTDEILREQLGISGSDVERLKKAGTI